MSELSPLLRSPAGLWPSTHHACYAIGLAAVLLLAGAPVRAGELAMVPAALAPAEAGSTVQPDPLAEPATAPDAAAEPVASDEPAPAASPESESKTKPDAAAEPPAPVGIAYEVAIDCKNAAVSRLLSGVSDLIERKDRPPGTLRGLRRRVETDRETFAKALRSRGYYDARLSMSLDDAATPVKVSVTVEAGPRYTIDGFDVYGLPDDMSAAGERAWRELMHVAPGAVARADRVIDAQKQLLLELRSAGYPLAKAIDRHVTVDHATRKMDISLFVETGARAPFGDISVVGLENLSRGYVMRRISLRSDRPYDPAKIDESRRALVRTGLFNSVRISQGDALDAQGRIPITVALTEGKMHTIGAGLKYSSSEGIGGRAYWEHHNLLGGGERLRVSAKASKLLYGGAIDYREPDFLDANQDLLLVLSYDVDDTAAFRSQALSATAGVERHLSKSVVAGLGVTFEQDDVRDQSVVGGGVNNDVFTLIGFPFSLRFDNTDDILDPSRGHRIAATLTPYAESFGSDLGMLVSRASETFYVPLLDRKRLTFAGRVTAGSISGASDAAVPANKRFYAGGGDSVRGYDFQLAGPLDAEHDPFGGRSLVQYGAELRWRMSQSTGLVPFVEAASVSSDTIPDLGARLFWGAGLGFRYYTPIGPVRVDVAVPLNRRGGVDDPFEIYISLGQAF